MYASSPLLPPSPFGVGCRCALQSSFTPHPPFFSPVKFSLNPLLLQLNPDAILVIFRCILLEKKMLFVSSDIGRLTTLVQSLLYLIFPMTWSFVYIPLLPDSLVEYLGSPVPFIMGLQREALLKIEDFPLDVSFSPLFLSFFLPVSLCLFLCFCFFLDHYGGSRQGRNQIWRDPFQGGGR